MRYLLSYYCTADEALYLAGSEDGHEWTALHEGRPVLSLPTGQGGIRDPFIRLCTDGDFHLTATGGGPRSMLHARSSDLKRWSHVDAIPIMAQIAGTVNVRAPEYIFLEEKEQYLLYWSSRVEDSAVQSIWRSFTEDFKNYTPPRPLFSPGYSVTDPTLLSCGERWALIYRDERGEDAPGALNGAMRAANSGSSTGPFQPAAGSITPERAEGLTVFRTGDRWVMLYERSLEGEWGACRLHDLLEWTSMKPPCVPGGARLGSVFALPRAAIASLNVK